MHIDKVYIVMGILLSLFVICSCAAAATDEPIFILYVIPITCVIFTITPERWWERKHHG